MSEDSDDVKKRSIFDKILNIKNDFFSIKEQVAKYQKSLDDIATEVVSLKNENMQLKESMFDLETKNKELNAFILKNKDRLE